MLELLLLFQKAIIYAKGDLSYLLPVIGSVQYIVLGLFYKKEKLIYLGFFLLILFAASFPFMKLIPNLGSDAFYEFQKINFKEALFYIKTLNFFSGWSIKHYILWLVILIVYTLTFFVLFFFSKKVFFLNFLNINYFIILFIIIVPIGLNLYKVSILYKSSAIEKINQEKNILYDTTDLNLMVNNPNDLSIILYLGESTSKLNWSIYDYFRPTNINLEKFNKENSLIIFDQVYSTHTHTSPSLLDALTIKTNSKDNNSLKITSNYLRYPIVDILNKKLIDTKLFSTQAKSGSWNLASSLIFKNAKKKKYSFKYNLGNANYVNKNKLYDHEFLKTFNDSIIKDTDNRNFYVFHSYAGHGNYKKNIPQNYHFNLDNYFSNHSNESIFGKYFKNNQKKFLENYDSAMRYVSDNILATVKKISDIKKPIVFIYTSDHGESPLTGRAHDSSRFIWEMSSVPFLIYFNDEAKSKYSELYKTLNYRSQLKNRELLNNLPSLILEIFNIKIINDNQKLNYNSSCKFGEGKCLDEFHTIRNQLNTLGVVNFNFPVNDKRNYIDNTDRATTLSNMHYYFAKNNKELSICSHQTNSIARFIRFNAILDCMDVNIIIEDNNLIVANSKNQSSNLNLIDSINVMNNKERILSIDVKNLNSPVKCIQLYKNLEKLLIAKDKIKFFIKFPSSIVNDLDIYTECIKNINKMNSIISYNIPSDISSECKNNESLEVSLNQQCQYLNDILEIIHNSKLFTDLSFDYVNYQFLKKTIYAEKFLLNTWHVPDDEVLKISEKNFRLILPFNNNVNIN
jgi:glucan phosphoethanolaminetransferase (alkaline phosphatase superfamily)